MYSLDPRYAEHPSCRDYVLTLDSRILCPVVLAETYHTLVFNRGFTGEDARTKLREVAADRRTLLANHTQRTSFGGMNLAVKYQLGGRDSLIISTYLLSGSAEIASHDQELRKLGKLRLGRKEISETDPLSKRRAGSMKDSIPNDVE